ncbi:MAG: hypothetical protein ACOX6E_02955 [Syntrophomonadaceae bacterium]
MKNGRWKGVIRENLNNTTATVIQSNNIILLIKQVPDVNNQTKLVNS